MKYSISTKVTDFDAVALKSLPFYQLLKGKDVLTLNYTGLVCCEVDSPMYFHGDLEHCICLETGLMKPLPRCESVEELWSKVLEPIWDSSKENFMIPAIIPPLKVKPLLSPQYIDRWYKAKEKIDKVEQVISIGYSWSNSDQHFNQLFSGASKLKKLVIVAPDAEEIVERIKKWMPKSVTILPCVKGIDEIEELAELEEL